MRQETIVKTYLTFDELDAGQKAKALDKYRDWNVGHEWSEHMIEDRTKILECLGFRKVRIEFSGFSCQGDGACFTGQFDVPKTKQELKKRIKAVKDFAPNFDLHGFGMLTVAGDDDLTLEVYKHAMHLYSHSGTVTTDDEQVTAFVRDFCNQFYKDLESEYQYLTSDEQVAESLIANEMEFDLDEYPKTA